MMTLSEVFWAFSRRFPTLAFNMGHSMIVHPSFQLLFRASSSQSSATYAVLPIRTTEFPLLSPTALFASSKVGLVQILFGPFLYQIQPFIPDLPHPSGLPTNWILLHDNPDSTSDIFVNPSLMYPNGRRNFVYQKLIKRGKVWMERLPPQSLLS